jgi:hypothetical protein
VQLISSLTKRGLVRVGGTHWPQWYALLSKDLIIFIHRDGRATAGNSASEATLAEVLGEVQ